MLTDLNPWVVSFHLLCSLAIIGVAVLFLHRLDRAGAAGLARGPVHRARLGDVRRGLGGALRRHRRDRLRPARRRRELPAQRARPAPAQPAARRLVFLFVGLTLGLFFALRATGGRAAGAPCAGCSAIEVVQGGVGFVQYFTDLPIVARRLHMLGAALVAAAVTWVLVRCASRLLGREASADSAAAVGPAARS